MHAAVKADTRFRVLVPVWGKRYVSDFCAISLPALIAEGNLPALIRHAECEIIFLTTRSSEDFFEKSEGIRHIKQFCPYSFVFIDDLLPLESYGIILTVAYGRGIASLGDLQTSTYFIFLNADFVLSNGILRTVVDRIGEGYSAVMSPSLRCIQEDVVVELQKRVSPSDGTLDASSPELVRLTLNHLHITARASVVNQRFSHHNGANQFFWKVDDDTLIGRFFLLFMLCIRPERAFTTCVGWCDYTFIPELVPSGNYAVIADSDEGFILEMQARRGDVHHVRAGRITPQAFAPRLSFWTTAEHRAFATRSIVFHTGPLPANATSIEQEAEAFMRELLGRLSQPAASHLHHPYWTDGLLHYQDNIPPHTTPPELPRYFPGRVEAVRHRFGRGRWYDKLRNVLTRALIGEPPKVHRLHFAFLDYDNFATQIGAFDGQSGKLLHVRARPSPLDDLFPNSATFTTLPLTEIDKHRSTEASFDRAILTMTGETIDELPRLLRLIAAHCADGAPVLICIDGVETAFKERRGTLYSDTIEFLVGAVPADAIIEDSTLITANERFAPAYVLAKMRDIVGSRWLSAWLAAYVIGLAAYGRLLSANSRRRAEGPSSLGICSSATIRLSAPWQSMTRALARRASQFDPAFYNHINTDVARAGLDAENHFDTYGWRERRDPSAYFSVNGYLSANPDVADLQINPLDHFRVTGASEGRNGWQK